MEAAAPSWSPTAERVAFLGRSGKDADRYNTFNVFVVDAKPGAAPRQLTSYDGIAGSASRAKPEWSPDGKLLTYLQSSGAKQGAYNMNRLAVISADGGAPRILAEKLDRGIGAPHFTRDGAAILALESDDRSEYPVRVPVSGGEVQRLARGPMAITSYEQGKDGRVAVIYANDSKTGEVYAFENHELRAAHAS